MIEMHIHLLPGVDDGSKSMEETEKMLRIIEDDGIDKVIATPHFYRGYYESSHEDIVKLVDKVNGLCRDKGINVEVHSGQEVFLDRHTLEDYEASRIAKIENTDYMLVELPMMKMPEDAMSIIYELRIKGIRPIMAHPERYVYVMEQPDIVNTFVEEGCLLQINSGSIRGRFGKDVMKTAHTLIKNGMCNLIGSDAHSEIKRKPGLSEAFNIVKDMDKDFAANLEDNSEKLFKNEDIELCTNRIKKKRGFFGFFKR